MSTTQAPQFFEQKVLKKDVFGRIEQGEFYQDFASIPAIRRVYKHARWWARPLAYYLARNEKKALARLAHAGVAEQVPGLLASGKGTHIRSYFPGDSIHTTPPQSPSYYTKAKYLLKTLRRHGISHNDLAKEGNWLMTTQGDPALVDFQLALCFKPNSKILRVLCREDLRHLLKHKRTYHPEALLPSEKRLLAQKAYFTQLWMRLCKPVYWFYTRKILRWPERNGPMERE